MDKFISLSNSHLFWPILLFAAGVLVLVHAAIHYGIPLLRNHLAEKSYRDMQICLISYVMIALALMLGLPGYWGWFNAKALRYVRIGIGVAGVVLLSYQFLELASRP